MEPDGTQLVSSHEFSEEKGPFHPGCSTHHGVALSKCLFNFDAQASHGSHGTLCHHSKSLLFLRHPIVLRIFSSYSPVSFPIIFFILNSNLLLYSYIVIPSYSYTFLYMIMMLL